MGKGCGGCRINSKTAKKSNTFAKQVIEEVLEAHEYKNHKQEFVKDNYVVEICQEIVGEFDFESKRLKSPRTNATYIKNIEKYLRENVDYYGRPDGKGRLHHVSSANVLLREYVFYTPPGCLEDEELFKSWTEDCVLWFKNAFPECKIVAAVGHFRTETSKHAHILFLPLSSEPGGKLKLANNRLFYDYKDGKKCRTGAIIQSQREQSFITLLNKYGIEGGIKGSKAKHTDLKEYASALTHEIAELEERKENDLAICQELETIEVKEVERLHRVEREHMALIQELDQFFAKIYDYVPEWAKKIMCGIADRFFHFEKNDKDIGRSA